MTTDARATIATTPPRRHLLTIGLEDYFQVGAFNQHIQRGQWYRFETRLETATEKALALLKRHNVKATFFVLGWGADNFPELVRRVADAGHEIASRGYYHRSIRQMTPAEFRDDLARARDSIERASGRRVHGFRVAHDWFGPEDLWALDVLSAEGYSYDSSICPLLRRFVREPWRRFAHQHQANGQTLWEFPPSTVRIFGLDVPIAGGNYFRQFPPGFIRRAVARWDRSTQAPFVMYFHTWELDPEQPMLSAGSFLTRVRHYRNLRRMESRIEYFLSRYTFTSIADYLGISPVVVEPGPAPARRTATPFPILMPSSRRTVTRTPVSIVVPCYNEELVLPYLANTLKSVRERLANDYDLTFLLVDDGSTDHTWNGLQQSFGSWADCRLLKHNVNQGVAASILTGIRAAQTEIVASIDCDCTYDPHELANMIPMLVEGVDLVTASPYHPQGHVRNVPAWRLQLSKGASWLYRRVLHQPLHTFTSCFRVYRRSAVCDLQLRERNFLGVTELLGRLLLRGAKVVEYPATLEVRMIGRSKMKTVRTILGHLRLMARLTAARFGQAQHAGPNTAQPIVVESPTDTVERQRA